MENQSHPNNSILCGMGVSETTSWDTKWYTEKWLASKGLGTCPMTGEKEKKGEAFVPWNGVECGAGFRLTTRVNKNLVHIQSTVFVQCLS